MDRRIDEAADAFAALKLTTFAQRADWMRATAVLLDDDIETVARLLTLEMGKPMAHASAEVFKCAANMRFCADNAAPFMADELLSTPSLIGAAHAYAR